MSHKKIDKCYVKNLQNVTRKNSEDQNIVPGEMVFYQIGALIINSFGIVLSVERDVKAPLGDSATVLWTVIPDVGKLMNLTSMDTSDYVIIGDTASCKVNITVK